MKRLSLLLILLISHSAYCGEDQIILGGVDVGNGMVVNSGFELGLEFTSEEELVKYFNDQSISIRMAEHKSVKSLIRLGKCQPGKVKLQNLHWNNYYPTIKEKLLKKRYKGVVNIGLYKCKRPEIVKVTDKLLPALPK